MSIRTAAVLFVVSFTGATIAACDGGAPAIEGFFSGGISGASCPPGTESSGSCSDPDCGVDCVATTSCEANETCPAGTVCGTIEEEKWCVPKTCDVGCAATEKCEENEFAKPVCLPE